MGGGRRDVGRGSGWGKKGCREGQWVEEEGM